MMNEIRNQYTGTQKWSEAIESDSNLPINSGRNLRGTCRCCLSEGNFETMELRTKQDPSLTYIDMMRTVLGLKLIYIGDARLICSTCAIRLRQAFAFRKQVVAAEQTFIARVQPQKDIEPEQSFTVKTEETQDNLSDDDRFEVPLEQPHPIDTNKVKLAEKLKTEYETCGCVDDDRKVENVIQQSDIANVNSVSKVKELQQLTFEFSNVFAEDHVVLTVKPKVPHKLNIAKPANSTLPGMHCQTKVHTETEQIDHLDKMHFMCSRCKRLFTTLQERKTHASLCSVQCSICDEIFSTPRLKKNHVVKVHGQKCSKCNERIKIADWYKHNFEMHGMGIYQCGICNKICRGNNSLHTHQRKVHMKEKNVKCPQCDHMAFDNNNLRKHMISHSTDKKFVCDYCNKGFLRKSTLRCHVMIHSKNKTKVCKLCGEAFVQRASLKYHLEKYHPGDIY